MNKEELKKIEASYEDKLRECGVKKLEIAVDFNEKLPFSVQECLAWDGEEDIPICFMQCYASLEELLEEITEPVHYPLLWAEPPAPSEEG